MASINSPFFNINYGWNLGEDGWNIGMDENLLVIGFLLKGSVDSFEATLPDTPISGSSVILTTENRAYFYVIESWLYVDLEEGFEFNRLSDNTRWRYTSGTLVQVPTNDEISTGLSNLTTLVNSIDNRVDTLETSVGSIASDASGLSVTSDSITQTLTEWMNFVRARDNHTGTQLAGTISDFAAAVIDAANSGFLSDTIEFTYNSATDQLSLEVKSDGHESLTSFSGVVTLSSPTGGFVVDLTENVTEVVIPPPLDRKNEIIIQFIQDDLTGGFTVSGWPVDVEWLEGVDPVINPAPESVTVLRLWNLGNTGWYGSDISKSYSLRGELGTAAFTAASSYATAAQGALADSAVQPGDLSAVATSGAASDVSVTDAGDYYTSSDVEGALQEIGVALADISATLGDITAALDAINGEVI